MTDLFAFLDAHAVSYARVDHPAVFTVEESKRLVPPLAGTPTKNLFLRDEKGRRHFLVIVGHDTQVDLRALAPVLHASKLSLGSPERLTARLGVEPGSVSLLALVNDPQHQVEVFFDRALWQTDALHAHPLVNTATLAIPRDGVERFLAATGHRWTLVTVPRS